MAEADLTHTDTDDWSHSPECREANRVTDELRAQFYARQSRKPTKRVSLDLPHETHRALREWVIQADTDVSAVLRILIGFALSEAELAARVESADRAARALGRGPQ
jgi:hypothetical protein